MLATLLADLIEQYCMRERQRCSTLEHRCFTGRDPVAKASEGGRTARSKGLRVHPE